MVEQPKNLRFEPIGYISTEMITRFDAPHQPRPEPTVSHKIELLPGKNFERALDDIAGFERIWIIWWAHKNIRWRPKVLPPRGEGIRRGVFATRSPHRPNAICLTCVKVLRVTGRTIFVGSTDLLDGTPILDIKPYIPAIDSFPKSRAGWVDALEASLREPPKYTVRVGPRAAEQVEWLRKEFSVDFVERTQELLARDPGVHRGRRIARRSDGRYRMGCGAWKVIFAVCEFVVTIEEVEPGYPKRLLITPGYDDVPDRDAQLAFLARWMGVEQLSNDCEAGT